MHFTAQVDSKPMDWRAIFPPETVQMYAAHPVAHLRVLSGFGANGGSDLLGSARLCCEVARLSASSTTASRCTDLRDAWMFAFHVFVRCRPLTDVCNLYPRAGRR